MNSPVNNPSPQFGTAEYVGGKANEACHYCHSPVGSSYYHVQNALTCATCAAGVRQELEKDSHTAYTRALLFGIGAAIAGMILYAAFEIATGLIVGYVALAVGWMVGTAMKKGSGGVGGRRYQIAAALLTYAAVSVAAVPVGINYAIKHRAAQEEQAGEKSRLLDEQKQLANESGQKEGPSAGDTATDSESSSEAQPPQSKLSLLGHLLLLGIASPFMELMGSGPTFGWLIGIFILFIGMRIAWRLTAGIRVAIDGPYNTPAS